MTAGTPANLNGLPDLVAETMKRAMLDYDRMSGKMGAWRAPESWIQSAIGRELANHYYVMLEARKKELLEWHRTGKSGAWLDEEERGGRFDIALSELTREPDEAPLIALIEVKKHKQRGDCLFDADRLRAMRKEIPSLRLWMAVHVENQNRDEIVKSLTVELGSVAAPCSRPYECRNVPCAAVVAEIR